MTDLLLTIFLRKDTSDREKVGILAGWVGLVTNILLFLVKLFSGIVTGSISITTDAINNLSDSSSSLITLVGFKMAATPADEEHPYGHARIEYIAGLLISCFIALIGVQFLFNSVKRTFSPEPIEFNWIAGAILIISIFAKLWQSLFYKKLGKEINSTVLLATAIDSRNDVISTLVVLISCIVQYFTGWMLDGPMGILVSIFVIYSGIGLLKETLTPLIGGAPDKEMVKMITEDINSYSSVLGIHDLMIHSYGPNRCFASVHVEVPRAQDIMISHEIIDDIERNFLQNHSIDLVIHLDPIETNDPEVKKWHEKIEIIAKDIDSVLSTHDFRMVKGVNHTNLIFDVTVPPRYKMKNKLLKKEFAKRVKDINPNFYVVITIDRSYISTVM